MFHYEEMKSFGTFEKAYTEKSRCLDVIANAKKRSLFKLMGTNLRLVYNVLLRKKHYVDMFYSDKEHDSTEKNFYDSMIGFNHYGDCATLRMMIDDYLREDLGRYTVVSHSGSFLGSQEELKKIWFECVGSVEERFRKSRLKYDITFHYTPRQLYESGKPKSNYSEVINALDCTLNINLNRKFTKKYVEFRYSYINDEGIEECVRLFEQRIIRHNKNRSKRSIFSDGGCRHTNVLMCSNEYQLSNSHYFMDICDLEEHNPTAVTADPHTIGRFIGTKGCRIKAINRFLSDEHVKCNIKVDVNPRVIGCYAIFTSGTKLSDDKCNQLRKWICNVKEEKDDLFEGLEKQSNPYC